MVFFPGTGLELGLKPPVGEVSRSGFLRIVVPAEFTPPVENDRKFGRTEELIAREMSKAFRPTPESAGKHRKKPGSARRQNKYSTSLKK